MSTILPAAPSEPAAPAGVPAPGRAASGPVATLEAVVKRYGKTEALRGLDLTLRRGEGIAAEITRARRSLDAAGVRLEWQAQSVRLQPTHEPVLSLVLREAVTNILRHAGATSCRLKLEADGRGTHLSVHDDGRGGIESEGDGLRGMRERVEALGGRIEIDSRRGTRLTVDIPAQAGA